ncbi:TRANSCRIPTION FACTOR BHLH74 [Salix viminalis]|uniref:TRANSCRIPTION FACTOR BHLH74 n=1 Tax=Salix viminalis TaxID=40686 RepID=A0A9Q0YXF7_SALVM|nr:TRANSCRIPTION FACTOR BHLH74 [Salix viminalis]
MERIVHVKRESKREKLPKSSVSRKLERVKPTKRQKTVPPADLPAGYVHVRARRGEATDSHSLAERARREKISAKMRLLQSLVPGCDGITGKAHILDEIIRHVQSLKDRVESLEAELVLVNETAINDFKMNYNMEAQAWSYILSSELQFLPDLEPGSSQLSPLGEISDAPTSLLQPQLTKPATLEGHERLFSSVD